jgi:[glutamine synthetase] adenylyltransferase / [glutamine synthetase]-adenylyl-L-tyrosine phosphorylase
MQTLLTYIDIVKDTQIKDKNKNIENFIDFVHKKINANTDQLLVEKIYKLTNTPSACNTLSLLFNHSSYIHELIIKFFDQLVEFHFENPDNHITQFLHGFKIKISQCSDRQQLTSLLRTKKNEFWLYVILLDFSNNYDFYQITKHISDFATLVTHQVIEYLMNNARNSGTISYGDAHGLFALGMGKLGANELNYSSDIDIILFYDPDKIIYHGKSSVENFYNQLARDLIQLIEEKTEDGYVFRVDLRLRPDPSSTPLAISVHRAETYYQSMAETWERAAFIKARVIAGDLDTGQAFLNFLTPFIWRKYLDFASFEDIQRLRYRILSKRPSAKDFLEGFNVKLGPGGIREIEFCAQSLQLIWGGRHPSLRVPQTLYALEKLKKFGEISKEDKKILIDNYIFLRHVEHRIQLLHDRQTHCLPNNRDDMHNIACLMGYESSSNFLPKLKAILIQNETLIRTIFYDPQQNIKEEFTLTIDHQTNISLIQDYGFMDPEHILNRLDAWLSGRYKSTRSSRSQALLKNILPAILTAFNKTTDPDYTFNQFDEFLSKLPAGVQLFSLFNAHPNLLDTVVEIMGCSPFLANYLSSHPVLLDNFLNPEFVTPLKHKEELILSLRKKLEFTSDFEEVLVFTRRWVNDLRFKVGIHILRNYETNPEQNLTDIAESALTMIVENVLHEFEQQHGCFINAEFAVLGYGSLGSWEMTISSDLDLVFIYDVPKAAGASDGAKPLTAQLYYSRLCQRLITALTSMTAEGILYDVDMRLRPSGNQGPLVNNIDSFIEYHQKEAWIWEQMALIRARPICGSPKLMEKLSDFIKENALQQRDKQEVKQQIIEIRKKIRDEKKYLPHQSINYMDGGLIDIEFITQYLILTKSHVHPGIYQANTLKALLAISKTTIIEQKDMKKLVQAQKLFKQIKRLQALTHSDILSESTILSLAEIYLRVTGKQNYPELRSQVIKYMREINQLSILNS